MMKIELFHMLALVGINFVCAGIMQAFARALGRKSGPTFWATFLFTVLIGAIVLAASPVDPNAAKPEKRRRTGPDHAKKIPAHLRRRDPDQAPAPVATVPPYARQPYEERLPPTSPLSQR